MTRSHLPAAALLLLAACSISLPVQFSVDQAVMAPSGAFQLAMPMDLSQEGDLWSRRTKMDAISVDEVSITVVSVGSVSPYPQASQLTVQLAFRPEGAPANGSQDVVLPSISGVPFAAGDSGTVAGSAALEDLLLSALRGSGRFQVVATGTFDGAVNATLRLQLRGSAVFHEAFN
jgi:hypothetical protein